MDVYEFRELVFNKFRERIKSGQHIGLAKSFVKDDFPDIPEDVIKEFCDMGYAKPFYYSNFSLNNNAIDEALDED